MRQEFDNLLSQLQRVSEGIRELGEGIRQVAAIASNDPEMALIRTRKVLEYVVRDVYARHLGRPPGTQPLENLLQQIAKEGYFPLRLKAYANVVKDLGNVGAHSFGEGCTQEDVQRSLTQLLPILEWYFQQERAVVTEPGVPSSPEAPPVSESVQPSPALSDRATSAEPPPAPPRPIFATQPPHLDAADKEPANAPLAEGAAIPAVKPPSARSAEARKEWIHDRENRPLALLVGGWLAADVLAVVFGGQLGRIDLGPTSILALVLSQIGLLSTWAVFGRTRELVRLPLVVGGALIVARVNALPHAYDADAQLAFAAGAMFVALGAFFFIRSGGFSVVLAPDSGTADSRTIHSERTWRWIDLLAFLAVLIMLLMNRGLELHRGLDYTRLAQIGALCGLLPIVASWVVFGRSEIAIRIVGAIVTTGGLAAVLNASDLKPFEEGLAVWFALLAMFLTAGTLEIVRRRGYRLTTRADATRQ
jgi:hypothetical protein